MKSVVVCSNCLGIINEYGACEHCLKAIIEEQCFSLFQTLFVLLILIAILYQNTM